MHIQGWLSNSPRGPAPSTFGAGSPTAPEALHPPHSGLALQIPPGTGLASCWEGGAFPFLSLTTLSSRPPLPSVFFAVPSTRVLSILFPFSPALAV